jgi:type 1 glutamine amidotransferase
MKLLVVSGGNHPYVESTPVLMELLQGAGHEVTLTEDAGLLAADSLSDCDVLVFNTLRRQETALSEAERAGMTRFIGGGKGFVCIHISGCAPEDWPEYHDVTGGGWIMGTSTHPPYGQFTVNVTGRDHPGAADITDFVTNDELYTKLGWRDGNDVFMTADLDGEPRPISWTRKYGNGRVFATTLGHDGLSFRTPQFQRLVLNGVDWAAGKR